MVGRLKHTIFILLISMNILIGAAYASDVELLVMTEEFPPFNFMEGDKINGLSTKIVRKILEDADLKYRLELVPWNRALNTALNRPNTLIYTIARTESRNDKFHWICKISNRKLSMFRLRSRHDLANMTIAEAKAKAKIALIQGDASAETIVRMGFDLENLALIRDASGGNLCIRHVMGGRSDFFLLNPYSLKHRIETGELADLFKDQFVIHNGDGYYIAASKGTKPSILKALREASIRLSENGFIDSIISAYLTF